MSRQKRDELVQQITETQPSFRGFLKDLPSDMTAGSWDLVSYSFQLGFVALWDLAYADRSGLLTRPLLSLLRQSVELTLKSSILDIACKVEGKPRHNLPELFKQLRTISADLGLTHDDELTRDVETLVAEIQTFDPFADRFRYPVGRKGDKHEGIEVDLDRVFQAHWVIVGCCEGTVAELGEKFGIGSP